MPILDEETEFAIKWSNLADAQVNEGIRDPIKAFEYMNRYYVLEGNKRVSVLKYYNAVSIPAYVTRKIPKMSDDYDIRLYYEYMKFNEITGLCSVEFSKLGNANKLLALVGHKGRWNEDVKEKLKAESVGNVFKHLKEDEIEQLTLEIANTRSISPAMKDAVLDEFYEVCLAQQYIAEGGIGYAKELLDKALGQEKAQEVISKLTASLQVRPFEFVRKTDPSQLLNFIQDEHPQTIAMILSYLTAAQAAMVLGALPPEKQADVAKRIAMMDRTSPDVIKEVERVLERRLSSLVNQDYTIVGGVDAIVNILNTVDRSTEKHIMESLEIEEPELADEIRKKMFVFEDILLLDDRAIQRVLRDVENSDLGIALKGANEDVQNAIFNNLSKRLAAMIKEDMEFMGPVRMKDVEEAQQKIVSVIRKLEDAGEIVISRGGGDEIIA